MQQRVEKFSYGQEADPSRKGKNKIIGFFEYLDYFASVQIFVWILLLRI